MPLLSCSWLLTTLLVAPSFSHQAPKRPDFTGTWVAISPGDVGFETTLKQTEKILEVSGLELGQRRQVIYNLDGSESRHKRDLQGVTIVTVSRATWNGDQLTITKSTIFPDGSKSEGVDTWSLDAKGDLVIEGTEKMTRADGTAGGTGKVHVVFRRKDAQSRPNFSGNWIGVSPQDNVGEKIVVTQTASTLTEAHGKEHSITHKLDGVQSRNAFPSHDSEIVMLSTAAWVGNTLVVKINTTYAAGNKVETRQVWSLDAEGQLNIEFTNRVNTPAEQVIKLVYKKGQ